jgi:hypothetical protein
MAKQGLRGTGIALPSEAPKVGLPTRVFLYTLDQLCVMIDLDQKQLERKHVYFEGRSVGARRRDMMLARNIAPPSDKPDWRVAEREFVRWLKFKGYRVYEFGAVSN